MSKTLIAIFGTIIAILFMIGLWICIYKVVKWNKNCNNCYYEKYMEYPCQGATHYARVHRNNNEPCERYRRLNK